MDFYPHPGASPVHDRVPFPRPIPDGSRVGAAPVVCRDISLTSTTSPSTVRSFVSSMKRGGFCDMGDLRGRFPRRRSARGPRRRGSPSPRPREVVPSSAAFRARPRAPSPKREPVQSERAGGTRGVRDRSARPEAYSPARSALLPVARPPCHVGTLRAARRNPIGPLRGTLL